MWILVESSNIKAIKQKEKDLIIMFHNGAQYIYIGASDHAKEMANSDSCGKYFFKNIKEKYEFRKL